MSKLYRLFSIIAANRTGLPRPCPGWAGSRRDGPYFAPGRHSIACVPDCAYRGGFGARPAASIAQPVRNNQ